MKEKKIMYAIQAQHWKAKLARKPLEDSLAFDDGKMEYEINKIRV